MNQSHNFGKSASRPLHGFTLIELVIVVAILGILATVAAPRYLDTLANYRADATAKRIIADLRFASRRAQQTSSTQTIEFYIADGRYEIIGMNDLDHEDNVYEYRFPEAQVTLVSADFGGSSVLGFDIYGIPSSAGTIVFNAGGSNQTIEITGSGEFNAPTLTNIADSSLIP